MINGRQTLNYSEVSTALVNYEVRRQDRLSSSRSTTVEALMVRCRSSNRKGRGDQGRLKPRSCFRDLKRNQCTLRKEVGHWKVDCPKVKGKKMESNTEANLAQAGGSDSDSSVLSFSVTTPIVGFSDNSE